MAYNVSRNLNFFTRIFTQFFGTYMCLHFVDAKMFNIKINQKRIDKNRLGPRALNLRLLCMKWQYYSYLYMLVEA